MIAATENRAAISTRDDVVTSSADGDPDSTAPQDMHLSDSVAQAVFTEGFLVEVFDDAKWQHSHKGVQGLLCVVYSTVLFGLQSQERLAALNGS